MVDAMRGLMALWVFAAHAAYYLGIGWGTSLAAYLAQHVNNYPGPAVVVFFAISGFVMYRPFTSARYQARPQGSLIAYLIRRLARVAPAYWVALAITGAVLFRHDVFALPGGLLYWGWAQVYDAHTLTRALAQTWTVDVELIFWCCIPLLVLLMRRWPARTRRDYLRTELALCAALYVASTVWQVNAVHSIGPQSRWFYGAVLSLPGSLDLFACGMALAVLSVAYEDEPEGVVRGLIRRAPWAPFAIAAVAFYLTGKVQSHHLAIDWLLTKQLRCVLGVATLLPLIFATSGAGAVRASLRSRPILYLGKICYGFYLWHSPVLSELWRLGVLHDLGKVAFVLIAFALSLGLGSLSWYLIELPVQQAARRWIARVPSLARSREALVEPEAVAASAPAP
jgi:peptidoglycan/LPS O-acetylase OafA/YrhL